MLYQSERTISTTAPTASPFLQFLTSSLIQYQRQQTGLRLPGYHSIILDNQRFSSLDRLSLLLPSSQKNMRNSVSPSKTREHSPSLKDQHIPMWDSSDPTRAPPPMPLHPDSPNLMPVGTGPVSGSPFKITSSPIRQSFASRNYSSINEDRLLEILEASRDIKAQNQMVETTVKDAMREFGNLFSRSKDNGSTLSTLINLIETTRESADKTGEVVKEKFPMIISSLDTQRESQRSLTTVADVLLEQTREFGRKMQLQESHIKRLLHLSESQIEEENIKAATKEDVERVVGRKTSTVLEEFNQFSENIGAQQQQTINLLMGLREYFDKSVTDFDSLYSQVANVVREETENVSTDITKTLQRTSDKTSEQLQLLDSDLLKVQDSLQASIAKAINNVSTLSRPEMPTHDHMIPEILTKLGGLEQQSQSQLEKTLSVLSEKIAEELEENKSGNLSRFNQVQESIRELTAQESIAAKAEQLQNVISKIDALSKSIHGQYQDRLRESEDRLADIQVQSRNAESEAQSRVVEAENQVAQLKARLNEVEDLLSSSELDAQSRITKAESQVTEMEGGLKEAKEKAKVAEANAQFRVSEAEIRVAEMEVRLKEAQDKAKIAESDAQSRVSEAEKRVAEMEARIKQMEQSVKQKDTENEQTQRTLEMERKVLQAQTIQECEKKVAEAEKLAGESNAQLKATEREMKMLKYFNHDIERHETVISELEEKIDNLQGQKAELAEQVGSLKTAYKIRVDELNQLETRVSSFELRLNQAILDRSKSILGSTTMAIINSAGDQHYPQYQQSQVAKIAGMERGSKGAGSPARRHLSMAPANFENIAMEDGNEKENDSITVMKRGSPFQSPKKHRSISLFVDK